MTDCIFCDIIAGQTPATVIYEDEVAIAFMDIQPINPGHLLVIPKVHATYLADMDEATGAHLFAVAMRLAAAVRRSGLRCEGIDLFLADGAEAGQEIFHVHLHVIPRFQGDGFGFRFGPNYRIRPPRADLDQAGARIRAELN
ncbi:MAG: HIT family protein [Chloroflexi bacterium]|nr:HIT family protein [Chloroflexota bacterium]MBU1749260.1 HIT family protein [Chloroflexota bacterium]MBU1877556.1 HIT family protein [Chloroflexota bacterium]